MAHCAPPYPGQEQGVWSKPLGLRRCKKGAHREIFPGLPERKGAASSTTPDQTESTCRSWEAAGGSPFSARELTQGGAAWKSSQRPSKRPLKSVVIVCTSKQPSGVRFGLRECGSGSRVMQYCQGCPTPGWDQVTHTWNVMSVAQRRGAQSVCWRPRLHMPPLASSSPHREAGTLGHSATERTLRHMGGQSLAWSYIY